jgi:hypothetical protein
VCFVESVTGEHIEHGNVPKTKYFNSTMLHKENFSTEHCASLSLYGVFSIVSIQPNDSHHYQQVSLAQMK